MWNPADTGRSARGPDTDCPRAALRRVAVQADSPTPTDRRSRDPEPPRRPYPRGPAATGRGESRRVAIAAAPPRTCAHRAAGQARAALRDYRARDDGAGAAPA